MQITDITIEALNKAQHDVYTEFCCQIAKVLPLEDAISKSDMAAIVGGAVDVLPVDSIQIPVLRRFFTHTLALGVLCGLALTKTAIPEKPAGKPCRCGSELPRRPLYDGNGIFCDYVCDGCEKAKRARYRPEIMDRPYTQDDVDEPIDPDD